VIALLTCAATSARGGTGQEWVSPAALDDVPIRAVNVAPEAAAVEPIVVPLPTGLASGTVCLAALAAARWWGKRRA
jgi:hypothetical protein